MGGSWKGTTRIGPKSRESGFRLIRLGHAVIFVLLLVMRVRRVFGDDIKLSGLEEANERGSVGTTARAICPRLDIMTWLP